MRPGLYIPLPLELPRVSPAVTVPNDALIFDQHGTRVAVVEAAGEGRLAQLLDLMYLGDWTSVHLAADRGVDPGPIDAIATLKGILGSREG